MAVVRHVYVIQNGALTQGRRRACSSGSDATEAGSCEGSTYNHPAYPCSFQPRAGPHPPRRLRPIVPLNAGSCVHVGRSACLFACCSIIHSLTRLPRSVHQGERVIVPMRRPVCQQRWVPKAPFRWVARRPRGIYHMRCGVPAALSPSPAPTNRLPAPFCSSRRVGLHEGIAMHSKSKIARTPT